MKARVKRAPAAGVACPWPDTPSLLSRLRSSRQRPRPILRRVILRPEAQSWRSGTSVSHQLWVLSTARCRVHRRPITLAHTTSTRWCITKRLPTNSCRERTRWPVAPARSTQPRRGYTLVHVGPCRAIKIEFDHTFDGEKMEFLKTVIRRRNGGPRGSAK